MVFLRRLSFLFLFFFMLIKGNAQVFKPRQVKLFKIFTDTIVLDSLSLVPGSLQLNTFPLGDTSVLPIANYKLHSLIFKNKRPDSLIVSYKRFPYNFEKLFFHKDPN